MKPIVFHVEAAGEFRPVEFAFATEPEVRRVRAWRKMTPATDAGEFAALAAKRWFYYTREGASVASLDELRAAIKRNERAELAFLMIASAEWAKRYKFLALAYCRFGRSGSVIQPIPRQKLWSLRKWTLVLTVPALRQASKCSACV